MKKFLLTTLASIFSAVVMITALVQYPRCTSNYSGNGTFFGEPLISFLLFIASVSLILAAILGDLILQKKFRLLGTIICCIIISFLLFLPYMTFREAIKYSQERNGLFNNADYCQGG